MTAPPAAQSPSARRRLSRCRGVTLRPDADRSNCRGSRAVRASHIAPARRNRKSSCHWTRWRPCGILFVRSTKDASRTPAEPLERAPGAARTGRRHTSRRRTDSAVSARSRAGDGDTDHPRHQVKEHPVKRTVAFIGSTILIAALAGSPVAIAQENSPVVVAQEKVGPRTAQGAAGRLAARRRQEDQQPAVHAVGDGQRQANDERSDGRAGADPIDIRQQRRDHSDVSAIVMSARTSTVMPRLRPMDSSVSRSG